MSKLTEVGYPWFLGADNLEHLTKLADEYKKQQASAAGSGTASGDAPAAEDDDDVPELVAGETFEAAAEEGQTPAS